MSCDFWDLLKFTDTYMHLKWDLALEELNARGGFHASVRLVALQDAPGDDMLLAIQVAPWPGGYFPALMRPGALDSTKWQGLPDHLSLCFASECPPASWQ